MSRDSSLSVRTEPVAAAIKRGGLFDYAAPAPQAAAG